MREFIEVQGNPVAVGLEPPRLPIEPQPRKSTAAVVLPSGRRNAMRPFSSEGRTFREKQDKTAAVGADAGLPVSGWPAHSATTLVSILNEEHGDEQHADFCGAAASAIDPPTSGTHQEGAGGYERSGKRSSREEGQRLDRGPKTTESMAPVWSGVPSAPGATSAGSFVSATDAASSSAAAAAAVKPTFAAIFGVRDAWTCGLHGSN